MVRVLTLLCTIVAGLALGPAPAQPEQRAPAAGSTAIACHADEPGPRLLIDGVVTDSAGRPIEGALVAAYNVDAKGLYNPPDADTRVPRIYARVTTDAKGRFQVLTVHPATYPDGSEPAHVHFDAVAPLYKLTYATIWFEGDPLITPERRDQARRGREVRIVRPARAHGLATAQVAIVLETN